MSSHPGIKKAYRLIGIGALLAFLAVLLGAFGAHALKGTLTDGDLTIWRTAVDYHLAHALAIIAIGLLFERNPDSKIFYTAGVLMGIGILIFSVSLYTLCLSGIRKFGMITPLGGLSFMIGWILLALGAFRRAEDKPL